MAERAGIGFGIQEVIAELRDEGEPKSVDDTR